MMNFRTAGMKHIHQSSDAGSTVPDFLQGSCRLSSVDAIHVAIVFEHLNDELDVLAKNLKSVNQPEQRQRASMPDIMDRVSRRPRSGAEDDIDVENQFELTIAKRIFEMNFDFYEMTPMRPCNTSALPLSMGKSQRLNETVLRKRDVKFLQKAVNRTISELVQRCSFHGLVDAFEQERCKKETLVKKFHQPLDFKATIKKLKNSIEEIKNKTKVESTRLTTLIWHYMNELEEVRIRTAHEVKYIEKEADVRMQSSRKFWRTTDEKYEVKKRDLKNLMKLEERCHSSMIDIIKVKSAVALEQLNFWTDKYESDKEQIVAELDILKEKRQVGLDRMEVIDFLTKQYMPIVEDHRRVKHIAETRQALQEKQNKKATLLQAWWRGTMVRRQFGPFHPKYRGVFRPVCKMPKIDINTLIGPKKSQKDKLSSKSSRVVVKPSVFEAQSGAVGAKIETPVLPEEGMEHPPEDHDIRTPLPVDEEAQQQSAFNGDDVTV